MIIENKKVAIIGGGPSGLMLARLLQQQGVDVKVYERDEDQFARQQGTTLDMHHDSGLKAIIAAGLLDEFKTRYRPGADKAVVVDSQMKILFNEHEDKTEETFGDELFRPEIDRGPLRDMLVGSLRPDNIVWNARFSSMTASGSGWQLQFENGHSAYADLVIAADGANSRLRSYITDIPPVYSGVTAIEGQIPHAAVNAPKLWQLAAGGSLFALEDGRTIMFITKGDGTLIYLIGLKIPENGLAIDVKDRAALRAWFRQEFATWSTEWLELFAAEEVVITPRLWYHHPIDQYWAPLPNLTMIGDAAHRMPAYAGEGANQALADALELSEVLCSTGYETLQEAIGAFEEKMRLRVKPVIEKTLRYTAAFHMESNQEFLLALFNH